MKRLIFSLLLMLTLFGPDKSWSQEIRKLPFEKTPVFHFALELEGRFIELFPLLYLENELEDLSYHQKERLLILLRDRDLGVCFNLDDDILKDFCKFYISLSLLGVDSEDLSETKNSFLLELNKLAKAISSLKRGNLINSQRLFQEVSDKTIKIFFKELSIFFNTRDIESIVSSTKVNILTKKAIVFKIVNENSSLINEDLREFLEEPLYYYYVGSNYFKNGNFILAGEAFLKSAKNSDIRDVALYNGVYSFMLGKKFTNANKLVDYLNPQDRKKFLLLLSILNNKKEPFLYQDFSSDRDFWIMLRELIKYQIERGGSLGFLINLNPSDIKDDEELLFLYCIYLLLERRRIDANCRGYKWTSQDYMSFFKDVSDNIINKKETLKILESYKLVRYFPFSKLYGDYLFSNNNLDRARIIYEEIIRGVKNISSDDLMSLYIRLSKIYRLRGSFFTSKKIIEEAMEKIQEKIDLLRLEQLKILEEEENWEELLWRSRAYLLETSDEKIKKELQKFIEMCYERLDKIKQKEK